MPQIFIKTLTGRKQAYNVEMDQTVSVTALPSHERNHHGYQVLELKESLQEKENIALDQLRLIYSGKQLADDKSLESYGIEAGGIVHMVIQLRGGN